MSFDGITIRAIVAELEQTLADGRIDKIAQPERDEVVLTVRSSRVSHRLLISCNASYPRLHLTEGSKESPFVAPMFCMMLRKHIMGGRIRKINQPEMERVVEIYIEAFNEIGDLCEKVLILEVMGRHSNIILVGEGGTVLDSIKHVPLSLSVVRQVLPGRPYVPPPSQGKVNPLNVGSFCGCDDVDSLNLEGTGAVA